jgi:arylsulfatase A-like enzyme
MPKPSGLNIVYIMTDQQRYDTLSCVGQTRCQTPNLDRLASEGVRFDNAYTVCALCSPARTSMLTGRYPHNHRMWNNNDMMQWAIRDLPGGERMISQDLVAAGYSCGYVGKWHCGESRLPGDYGFVGMDVPNYGDPYQTKEYSDYLVARGFEPPRHVPPAIEYAPGHFGGPVEACAPHFLVEYALDLLADFHEERERSGKPFMLFLSFWGPHAPYLVPEPFASMYDPAEVELWTNFHDDLAGKPRVQDRFRRAFSNYPDVSDDAWRDGIAKYWGFCSFIDAEIGRLLDALQEMGREDDTAVLFSTDHGDMTGSHGGIWDKSAFMYEETYHIPLIARVPGMTVAGTVCRAFVSNMDLATTVLDIAGLPVPIEHDGRSLAPLLRDPQSGWRDDLMSEFHGHRFLYSQRMVRWSDYKYVFNAPDEDELYDLVQDPRELVNLVDDPAHSEVAEEGRQRLLKWIRDTDDPIWFAARHMLGQCG